MTVITVETKNAIALTFRNEIVHRCMGNMLKLDNPVIQESLDILDPDNPMCQSLDGIVSAFQDALVIANQDTYVFHVVYEGGAELDLPILAADKQSAMVIASSYAVNSVRYLYSTD